MAVGARRLALRRIVFVLGVGLISAATFLAVAYADTTVAWFYPPSGWAWSYGSPYGTDGCGSWSHDIATYADFTGTQIYVGEIDLTDGYSTNGNVWDYIDVDDDQGHHFTEFYAPNVLMSDDEYWYPDEYFHYPGSGQSVPREANWFRDPMNSWITCTGQSDGVYNSP